MTSLFGDIGGTKRKGVVIKDLPPIRSNWLPLDNPPNLDSAWILGVDTETYDPQLEEAGPGWARGKGHIAGVSIAAEDRAGNVGSWYFPLRHTVEPQYNLDPDRVLPWLDKVLSDSRPKVGANLLYDIGWLRWEGVRIRGPFHDVQFAEAILDNNALVALDVLSKKYLQLGKYVDELEPWVLEAYWKGKPSSRWRKDIYRSSPRLVGPYAEADAWQPLQIIKKQWYAVQQEGMGAVYDLEHGLIDMLIAMRMAGVPVDVEQAYLLREQLTDQIHGEYEALFAEFGIALESTTSSQLARILDVIGITYPRTKVGSPSIEKEWLRDLPHPIGDRLNLLRELEKMVGTFISSYIIDKQVNGLIYPQFHPLKSDDGGTKLGRYSSSDPNLQNIPVRTDLGTQIRSLFIPRRTEGHTRIHKKDLSQVHYRILADIAVDRGDGSADALRRSYIDDPTMDYHMKVYQSAAPLLGWPTNYVYDAQGRVIADNQSKEIKQKRKPIKNVNFGLIYGQGETSLAYKAGFDKSAANTFFNAYHRAAPYVKATMEAVQFEAERMGYVTTLLGRKVRFDMYEPKRERGKRAANPPPPLPWDRAVEVYGTNLQLAFLYKSVNYKIQGSEPDIIKSAQLAMWNSGVFDTTGVPLYTVHDENDWSLPPPNPQLDEAMRYIAYLMENTLKLRVPLAVDSKEGINWGLVE